MSYADSILDQINTLREARVDALADGKVTQAGHMQRAIVRLFDRYCALTGDVNY